MPTLARDHLDDRARVVSEPLGRVLQQGDFPVLLFLHQEVHPRVDRHPLEKRGQVAFTLFAESRLLNRTFSKRSVRICMTLLPPPPLQALSYTKMLLST